MIISEPLIFLQNEMTAVLNVFSSLFFINILLVKLLPPNMPLWV